MDWLARNGRGFWLIAAFIVCWLFVAEPAPAAPADGSAAPQIQYSSIVLIRH